MSAITVENILTEAVIGVEDWERRNPIPLLATLTVTYDSSAAELSDDVSAAVDYALLTQTAIELIRNSSFRLLETLAGKTADLILTRFPVAETATVSLCKPGIIREAAAVWVTVTRQRASGDDGRGTFLRRDQ